jgi:hypothetical protein
VDRLLAPPRARRPAARRARAAPARGAPPPGDGLAAAERDHLADGTANAYRAKTLAGFSYALHKLQWFCSHSHESAAAVAFLKGIGIDEPRGFNYNLVGDEGAALAVRAIKWAGANFPGWHEWKEREGVGAGRPAPASITWATLETFLSALQALFSFQSIKENAGRAGGSEARTRLGAHPDVAAAVKQVKQQIGLGRGVDVYADADPQDGGGADYTMEELRILAKFLLDSGVPGDALSMALFLMQHFSISRGDDLRQMRYCHLLPPANVSCIGPSPAWILGFLLHAGKAQALNSTDRKLVVRHRDVLLDPQGALARHFASHFVLQNVPFPDVLNQVVWRKAVLFHGANLEVELTDTAHRARLSKACARAGVPNFGTHAFRRGGAKYLDVQGVAKETIDRIGSWLATASDSARSYLAHYNPQAVIAAAGFRGAAEHNYGLHFEPRFSVGVPDVLVDFYYPFLPDQRARLAAVRARGGKVPTSAASMVAVLEYLARVGVQDALDIVELYYGPEAEGSRNPVVERLMGHPAFEEHNISRFLRTLAAVAADLVRTPPPTARVRKPS